MHPLMLFVLLYKLVINIKYADGILKCGRSLPELVENDSNDSNFATANEICGVVLLLIFFWSEEVN